MWLLFHNSQYAFFFICLDVPYDIEIVVIQIILYGFLHISVVRVSMYIVLYFQSFEHLCFTRRIMEKNKQANRPQYSCFVFWRRHVFNDIWIFNEILIEFRIFEFECASMSPLIITHFYCLRQVLYTYVMWRIINYVKIIQKRKQRLFMFLSRKRTQVKYI